MPGHHGLPPGSEPVQPFGGSGLERAPRLTARALISSNFPYFIVFALFVSLYFQVATQARRTSFRILSEGRDLEIVALVQPVAIGAGCPA